MHTAWLLAWSLPGPLLDSPCPRFEQSLAHNPRLVAPLFLALFRLVKECELLELNLVPTFDLLEQKSSRTMYRDPSLGQTAEQMDNVNFLHAAGWR